MDGWLHEVLTDADLSVQIRVVFEDDSEHQTRGRLAYKPPVDSLAASEWNAWIPTPESESRAARLYVTRGTVTDAYQVLYPERHGDAPHALVSHDVTRYQLCPIEADEPALGDFAPADFDTAADFA